MHERLRFSPDILARLGEELVPDIDQGIIELAKNAYDADATECRISLHDLRSGSGSIVVEDNGIGLTEVDIRQGWLIIGRSSKHRKARTPIYDRITVGDKGLGRLAALRLGRQVTLRTRPSGEPGRQYELTIDWEAFDQAEVVEDVSIEITVGNTEKPRGTEIVIERISARIGRTTVNKLARSLLLLSDPFVEMDRTEAGGAVKRAKSSRKKAADPGFAAELLTPDYADLQAKVGQSYFSDAEYRIHARLHSDGVAEFCILDWKGDTLHTAPSESRYEAPPFQFDLWVFILDARSFSNRSSTIGEVRDWLNGDYALHNTDGAKRLAVGVMA